MFLFACLGACTSTMNAPGAAWTGATFTGSMPSAVAATEKDRAPEETTLPVSAGITTGPSTFLIGATLDFVLDKNLTFGPSLLYGFDDNVNLATLTGQVKYFLAVGEDKKERPKFQPYITGGVGVASMDKEGHEDGTGATLNIGAGARLLTGEHYRLGSEVRWNILPGEVGDERSFLSWEILQVVISF
jgi:hypothetical protein